MNAKKLKTIFQRFSKHNQTPQTELAYSTPYELLVAVMLSAQMTDKGVNKVTPRLFSVANTPEKMVKLNTEQLSTLIKSINYYKTKAKHLIGTAQMILSEFGGQIPHTLEDLIRLPGVGRKTANVILSTAFKKPAIAVDTHVFRIANRTHLAKGKTVAAVEKKLMASIPAPYLRHANHWLVLHGRYVCTARNPKCKQCIINDLCEFKSKNL